MQSNDSSFSHITSALFKAQNLALCAENSHGRGS